MTTAVLRDATDEPARIKLLRLLWGGPLTLVLAVAAVLLIRAIAVAILNPDPKFLPLTMGPPIFDTVFFGAWAVLVFLAMGRYSSAPIRAYRSLAWKVLIVSFAPDIALATLHWFGGGWPQAVALMTMHVAVWGICVTMLPYFVAASGWVGEAP
jgi:hypothetical protein